jgi:hypothetical protein
MAGAAMDPVALRMGASGVGIGGGRPAVDAGAQPVDRHLSGIVPTLQ